jgi:hypothetical protein
MVSASFKIWVDSQQNEVNLANHWCLSTKLTIIRICYIVSEMKHMDGYTQLPSYALSLDNLC